MLDRKVYRITTDDTPTLPPFITSKGLFQEVYLSTALASTLPILAEEATDLRTIAEARSIANTALAKIQELWKQRKAQMQGNESTVERFIMGVCKTLNLAPFSQSNILREDTTTLRLTLFADIPTLNAFVKQTDKHLRACERYVHALALVEVEHVGKDFNPKGAKGHDHPVRQIIDYLTFTGVPWGILTDGHRWRVYRRFDPPRFDLFLEIDLATILEMPDQAAQQEAFWWFYAMFSREAFNRYGRQPRLEMLYQGSKTHATRIQNSLREQAYHVVEELARGIITTHPTPATADLAIIYEQAIILLYRLLFLKFAEDRELLPVQNLYYHQVYSYRRIQDVLLMYLDDPTVQLGTSSLCVDYWRRLALLFECLNTGNSEANFFPYNGGVFCSERFEGVAVPDAFLARALAHLARVTQDGNVLLVNYRDIATRHLGSIYEGLLEQHLERENGTIYLVSTTGERINQRHTSGSYYTPDYIVDYIVQQTIAPLCAGKSAEEIAQIAILDPSMGSGHFLIAALMELARSHATAKQRQAIPESQPEQKTNQEQQLTSYVMQIAPTEEDLMESVLELVEHCIYGVDLNPLAVELTKLVLWLSTMDYDRPLAFLDHHLRVGNSLVGAKMEQLGMLDVSFPTANGQSRQMGLVEQVFVRVQQHLLAYFQRIAALPSQFPEQVRAKEVAYAEFREYSVPFRMVAHVWTSHHLGNRITEEQYGQAVAALDNYYAQPSDTTRWEALQTELWFIQAQELATQHNVFHWELEFPQVFLREHRGFDGVFGNPPYVRQELFQNSKPLLQIGYPRVYHGTADLYVYFVAQGVNLLRWGGLLAYISSNKWLRANYGTKLRSYLAQESLLTRIIDFGDARIFPEATAYPAILMLQNSIPPTHHNFPVLSWHPSYSKLEDFADSVEGQSVELAQDDLSAAVWSLGRATVRSLLAKLRRSGTPLGEYVQGRFYRGISTGLNAAFIVDGETRGRLVAEHPSSAELLKPFLRGRDVKRWRVESKDLWIIFPYRGRDITAYPAIYQHLLGYKARLEQRALGSYAWYELQSHPADTARFEQPKIIYPDIANSPAFAYDDRSYYPANTLYVLPTMALWLLGIVNSAVISWFFSQISTQIRGGYVRFIAQYVEQIPIPAAPADVQEEMGTLAQALSQQAQARYYLHQQVRHRILTDMGTHKLNQKLSKWWELEVPAIRREVNQNFGKDVPVWEREEWEVWMQEQREQHHHLTAEIVRQEKALNTLVYAIYDLSTEEIALVEEHSKYP